MPLARGWAVASRNVRIRAEVARGTFVIARFRAAGVFRLLTLSDESVITEFNIICVSVLGRWSAKYIVLEVALISWPNRSGVISGWGP